VSLKSGLSKAVPKN